MGFLTGTMKARTKLDPKTDLRAGFDRFTPEAMAANQPIVDLVAQVAERKSATPSQIALAWLMAQKPWNVPIPGTREIQHLRENLGALDVELSADDLREIDAAFADVRVQGGRMNAEQMRVIDQTA
jgi:aryl-alcohol dehydrogenase-like predicted oxidoreductase